MSKTDFSKTKNDEESIEDDVLNADLKGLEEISDDENPIDPMA